MTMLVFIKMVLGLLRDDFDGDGSDTPLLSSAATRHPNVNLLRSPLRVHPVSDREDFIAVMGRNTYFRAERDAIHGDNPVVDFLSRSRGKRVPIALVNSG